ncbi:MAG TPA: aromatic-ring-hydroxylating dioxygenase subunit beta [Dehalococcoidia bacterium]|nr:aromatic-ring-hydroxylating dioxygenase subunit beta [Dehalococcoidia bacterium]
MATEARVDRHEIENFIFKEARLIDEGKFEEWLDLFAEETLYWAPCNRYDIDPSQEVSLIYDDRGRLNDRVWRLRSGLAYSQEPASRTRHLISNVEIVESSAEKVVVSSSFAIFELRKGIQRTYAGRFEHHLVPSDGSWKITFKKIDLLNNDEPIDNLTFLL